MARNFDLFIGDELRPIGAYVPEVEALRNIPARIVTAARETSGEQAPRRAAVALAGRLGIAVTYLPGGHGGWGRTRKRSPTSCTTFCRKRADLVGL